MSSLITVCREISMPLLRVSGRTAVLTVLNLDSRCLELSSLQQCRDISPGALCLGFLFLLECSKTLDRQTGRERDEWGGPSRCGKE